MKNLSKESENLMTEQMKKKLQEILDILENDAKCLYDTDIQILDNELTAEDYNRIILSILNRNVEIRKLLGLKLNK
jgi:hypothetical protein